MVTIASWTFCSTRIVEAVPVWWMSRFCVVSEWPQMSVPPLTGASSASDPPGLKPPPIAAPPISVAVVFKKSLRFIIPLPS